MSSLVREVRCACGGTVTSTPLDTGALLESFYNINHLHFFKRQNTCKLLKGVRKRVTSRVYYHILLVDLVFYNEQLLHSICISKQSSANATADRAGLECVPSVPSSQHPSLPP